MSNKDVKRGIAIQANTDAAKVEKLVKGLKAHREVLTNLESNQFEIRDSMDIILNDLSDSEALRNYNIQITKEVTELDITEKRVLCACIYTLLSSYHQNNIDQTSFYTNLEEHLQITERKSDFNFENLNKIDSHTDRLVILKSICSFLFLSDESFNFLLNKDSHYWMFSFTSFADIQNVCNTIYSEYLMLGTEGIINQYHTFFASNESKEELSTVIETSVVEQLDRTEWLNEKNFEGLSNIIKEFVKDEKAFGKSVVFTKKDLKNELQRTYSNVAYDSLIAVSKVDNGYLIFTTYALYLKERSKLLEKYECIPFSNICVNKITTSKGKKTGTSKMSIPISLDDGSIKTFVIDVSKLEEERLRDLFVEISKSGCAISQTDRVVQINELSKIAIVNLLSSIVYIFRNEKAYLTNVYLLAKELGQEDCWDQFASNILNEDTLKISVEEFFDEVPYPSIHSISQDTIELIMELILQNNIVNGNPSTTLSIDMNNYIRIFDNNNISTKNFNIMLLEAEKRIRTFNLKKYIRLKEDIMGKDLTFKENILAGIEQTNLYIENRLEYKTKETIKIRTKEAADAVNSIPDKVKEGLHDIKIKLKK